MAAADGGVVVPGGEVHALLPPALGEKAAESLAGKQKFPVEVRVTAAIVDYLEGDARRYAVRGETIKVDRDDFVRGVRNQCFVAPGDPIAGEVVPVDEIPVVAVASGDVVVDSVTVPEIPTLGDPVLVRDRSAAQIVADVGDNPNRARLYLAAEHAVAVESGKKPRALVVDKLTAIIDPTPG